MTGGRRPDRPEDPDPSPTPLMMEETEAAKSKVGKKKKGRKENILAGMLMSGRRNILNTQFKSKLGE